MLKRKKNGKTKKYKKGVLFDITYINNKKYFPLSLTSSNAIEVPIFEITPTPF